MAQKVHDLVFVSAGTPGLDLTWSPSEGVMMMMIVVVSARCMQTLEFRVHGALTRLP